MKKEILGGKYILEIISPQNILIIEDLFREKFDKKKMYEINKTHKDSDILLKDIIFILSLSFSGNKIDNILKLFIEDGVLLKESINLGNLNIDEYGIYHTLQLIRKLNIKDYCFIGGQILKYYNLNRMTSDTDIMIIANNEEIKDIFSKIKKLQNVNIVYSNIDSSHDDPLGSIIKINFEGIDIDLISTKYKFQDKAIKNPNKVNLTNGEIINILSLKDLILFKIYANSLKDLGDIDSLLRNNILLKSEIEEIKKEIKINGIKTNFLLFNIK